MGDLERLAEARSTTSMVAEALLAALNATSFLLGIVLLLCSQASPGVVLPSSRATMLPAGVICVGAAIFLTFIKSLEAVYLRPWLWSTIYASIFVGFLSLVVVVGRRINDSSFCWNLMNWFIFNLMMTVVIHQMLWYAVPDWTDLTKALFVILVVPVAAEAALTVGRFASRGITDRHEAAGWVLNGYILMVKNVNARLIMYLIKDPLLALLAALIELPNNFCNEDRDRCIYRSSSRISARHESSASKDNDPTRMLRNRTLKLRLLHAETTLEIICTFVGAFVILSYGISLDGVRPPEVDHVMRNAAIQLFAECAQSLGCMLFNVVIDRRPAMSVPLLRMRGFSLMVTLLTTMVWFDCVASTMTGALGRRADSTVNWVFVTGAFVEEFNVSALCAAYPILAKQETAYNCPTA